MNSTSNELLSAIRGPVVLIVLGGLFVIQQHGSYPIWQTWPVILILVGLMKLAERAITRGGGTQ